MASSLTLADLATLVGGRILCGDHSARYTGLAALDGADQGDVSFLGNEKYHPQFLATRAGAILVPPSISVGPAGAALVVVENPTLAFSAVVGKFIEISRIRTFGVHPRAFVDPSAQLNPEKVSVLPGAVVMAGATIGDGTTIGAHCFIGEDAIIGTDCQLMAGTTVRERCHLGHRVVLQPGVVIGSDGFGYELSNGKHVKIDQVGIVVIGDDVEIGANTTIDRARFGKTIIGEGTKIDNLVQIGHNCVIGKHCLIVALTGISGSTKLGDYVTVAGQVGIAGHLSVGDHVSLAARTGVSTSLEGGQIYGGNPAMFFKDNQKLQATLRRVPKLVERVKALENTLKEQPKSS